MPKRTLTLFPHGDFRRLIWTDCACPLGAEVPCGMDYHAYLMSRPRGVPTPTDPTVTVPSAAPMVAPGMVPAGVVYPATEPDVVSP